MALFEATQRALELQPLVGQILNHNGLKVRAILPAPVEPLLFTRFIHAVKDEVLNEKTGSLYSDIADIIGANNFDIAVLYEGDPQKRKSEMPNDIKWEWYNLAAN